MDLRARTGKISHPSNEGMAGMHAHVWSKQRWRTGKKRRSLEIRGSRRWKGKIRPRYRRRIEVADQTNLPFAWMPDGLRSISERVALAYKMHSAFEMVVDRILLTLSSNMYSYFLQHEGDGEKNDI